MSHSDPARVDFVKCLKETDKALLVQFDDGNQEWIPKSVIHDDSEVFDADQNNEGMLVVKEWFAEKKGW